MTPLQLLFIGIGLLSIIILYYSIHFFIKAHKCKTVIEFPVNSNTHNLEFKTSGLFSLCFIGTKNISSDGSFKAMIYSSDFASITLKPTFPNWTFKEKGVYGVEYFKFKIKKTGYYTLDLKNHNGLKTSHFVLPLNGLSDYQTDNSHLKIRIKQAVPSSQRLFSILGLVLGINGLTWGIMIGVFNIFSAA
ncbi:hypothetical protein BBFL7_02133 [Flavobacteria bacterium BBFL7]|nr:hypothetical protein BBFL7_02133 [Flavobacteria bacterium BBFL7]